MMRTAKKADEDAPRYRVNLANVEKLKAAVEALDGIVTLAPIGAAGEGVSESLRKFCARARSYSVERWNTTMSTGHVRWRLLIGDLPTSTGYGIALKRATLNRKSSG